MNTKLHAHNVKLRNGEGSAGFSLVELLVVIAILAVLAAIAIPLFLNQRERAARAQLTADARNAGVNLSGVSKLYNPSSPATITWNAANQSFTVGTETVPSPVSSGSSVRVVGNTNNWCVSVENFQNGGRAVYGSGEGGQCNVWSGTSAGVVSASWRSVVYGEGKFVAVANSGNNARVMVSNNGVMWEAVSDGVNMGNSWVSVAYGNGVFVAVATSGDDNRVMVSTDGMAWEPVKPSETVLPWSAVTYGDGKFVAVSWQGRSMGSTDGYNWVLAPENNGITMNGWSSLTYGGGKYVAVTSELILDPISGGSYPETYYMASNDGETWTSFATKSGSEIYASAAFSSIAYGDGTFVSASLGGLRSSTDGQNFTLVKSGQWLSVVYGDRRFVATAWAGSTNRVSSSQNGSVWVDYGPENGIPSSAWRFITYGNGSYVALANSGNPQVMVNP